MISQTIIKSIEEEQRLEKFVKIKWSHQLTFYLTYVAIKQHIAIITFVIFLIVHLLMVYKGFAYFLRLRHTTKIFSHNFTAFTIKPRNNTLYVISDSINDFIYLLLSHAVIRNICSLIYNTNLIKSFLTSFLLVLPYILLGAIKPNKKSSQKEKEVFNFILVAFLTLNIYTLHVWYEFNRSSIKYILYLIIIMVNFCYVDLGHTIYLMKDYKFKNYENYKMMVIYGVMTLVLSILSSYCICNSVNIINNMAEQLKLVGN